MKCKFKKTYYLTILADCDNLRCNHLRNSSNSMSHQFNLIVEIYDLCVSYWPYYLYNRPIIPDPFGYNHLKLRLYAIYNSCCAV